VLSPRINMSARASRDSIQTSRSLLSLSKPKSVHLKYNAGPVINPRLLEMLYLILEKVR
jgi:hypothetical protein